MGNVWLGCKVSICAGLLATATLGTISLASPSASAALRYRTDGNDCFAYGNAILQGSAQFGPLIRTLNETQTFVGCPIPLGPGIVMLNQSPLLKRINVRYQLTRQADATYAWLTIHDYDSTTYCNCATVYTGGTTAGYHMVALPVACPSSCTDYGDWSANLEFGSKGTSPNEFRIKLISTYDS